MTTVRAVMDKMVGKAAFADPPIGRLLALLVTLALLAGCRGDNAQEMPLSGGNAQEELTHIVASIVANPHSYEGQRVTVVGYYRGWDLLREAGTGPPVTRSDWVIKDTSGAIYVSARSGRQGLGSLDPASRNDAGAILKLVGLVHVSAEGQPYIDAESIAIQTLVSFTDDTGRTINLLKIPQRIVSIGPTTTGILVALGASENIVGIDDISSWSSAGSPPPRLGKPWPSGDVIGPELGIDIDTVVALHPDLVIANVGAWARASKNVPPDSRDLFLGLEKAGIPSVYLNDVVGVTGALKRFLSLGALVGESAKANELVTAYEKRKLAVLESVQDLPKVRVALVRGYGGGPPAPGPPVAEDEPLSELIQLAGGVNVFTSSPEDKAMVQRFSQDPFTLEPYIAKNPEVILVIGDLRQMQMDRPGWEKVDAVQKGRVHTIGAMTPLTVLDTLEEIARLLHPALGELDKQEGKR